MIASLEEERAGIQATLAQAEEQIVNVQVVVSSLETQRDQVIIERDSVTDERDELMRKRDELISETQALSAERDNLIGEVGDLTGQRDSLTVERDSLTTERDELNRQLADSGAKAEALELHIADITTQATSLQADFQTLRAERAAVNSELQRINADLASSSTNRKAMLQSLSGQLSEAMAERDELSDQLAKSQQSLAALRSVFANLNNELDTADAVASEALGSQAKLAAAIDRTGSGLENLSASEDPAAPNLSLLNSQLGESAGVLSFTDSAPPPPAAWAQPVAAPSGGPAYEAPKPPVLADNGDVDQNEDLDQEVPDPQDEPDELDTVSEEIASELGDDAESVSPGRRAIEIPDWIQPGTEAMALHVAKTSDVVLLIQGDAVASMGWPSMTVSEQRNALVTYLNELAGDTGAAPDVMFDAGVGGEADLPESRVVRIRLSNEGGSDTDQIADLISTYPEEWPIAVVTDEEVLATRAASAGATVLGNGQLLDLFK